MIVLPDDQVLAFEKILRLSDDSSARLAEALGSIPITPSAKDAAVQIAGRLPDIGEEDLVAIVDAIYGLYWTRAFADVSPEKFLADLMTDVGVIATKEPLAADAAKVRKRLDQLLGIGRLNALHKAVRLQRDGERLYCEAKIISDIRPIFGEETTVEPIGAVVTHTLRLSYHEEGVHHHSIFVVLDQQDLEALKEVVDRAVSKDTTLRNFLGRANMPEFGV